MACVEWVRSKRSSEHRGLHRSLLLSGVQGRSSGPGGGGPRPAPSAEARAPSAAPTVGVSPAARALLSGEKKKQQKTLTWCLSCLSLL